MMTWLLAAMLLLPPILFAHETDVVFGRAISTATHTHIAVISAVWKPLAVAGSMEISTGPVLTAQIKGKGPDGSLPRICFQRTVWGHLQLSSNISSPEEYLRTWQFSLRAALSPRAPDSV